MAYVAVDEDKAEYVYDREPRKLDYTWRGAGEFCELPRGSIEKLIGRKLTWEDEPAELKETSSE